MFGEEYLASDSIVKLPQKEEEEKELTPLNNFLNLWPAKCRY
jgi:hypothetical protein